MPAKDRKTALNLEDIARLSGVSRSTVSRVINSSPNVSEVTRKRVLEIIEEHNFSPNTVARSLVTQRMRVLGIYIPYLVRDVFADPYFPMLLQAITTRANEQDHDVMLWLRGQNVSLPDLHRRVLDNRVADGIILTSTSLDDTLLGSLIERERPYVLNGRPIKNADETNYVDAANRLGARQAVEHLLRLGRRRIATITGRTDISSGYDRWQGYLDAIKNSDFGLDESLVFTGDYTENSGYIGMRALLHAKPDAVFAGSDQMALGVLRALREAGIRVPDDIAVVGFDDMSSAATTTPPLTTIRQPVQRLGYLATEGLIGILDGTITPPFQVSLPTQLVIRESCGFPT